MQREEVFLNIATIFLSTILSAIVSIIIVKYEIKKNNKKEKFKEFYNKFIVLRDSIHRGRAYDFSDLTIENQEQIIGLLIETNCYQNKKISNWVYELKTNQLDNFNNLDSNNIKKSNELYNLLTEEIYNKYDKYKKSYA